MPARHLPKGLRSCLILLSIALLLTSCDLKRLVGDTGSTESARPSEPTNWENGIRIPDEDTEATLPTEPPTEPESEPADGPEAPTDPDTLPQKPPTEPPTEEDSSAEPDTAPVTAPPTEPETPCTHDPQKFPDILPTCTQPGATGETVCGDCGVLLIPSEPIAPPGHRYDPFTCTACGHELICPTPVFAVSDEQSIPFGLTITVDWLPCDGAYPVEYRVFLQYENEEPTPETGWKREEAVTVTAPRLARAGRYTLLLEARYTSPDGQAHSRISEAAGLTVYIQPQKTLPSPAFFTEGTVTVNAGESLLVEWSSEESEWARLLYTLTLEDPSGRLRTIVMASENTRAAVPGEFWPTAGTYLLRLTARDGNGVYLPSEETTLSVTVLAVHDEPLRDYADPAAYHNDYFYQYLSSLPNGTAYRHFYDALDVCAKEYHAGVRQTEYVQTADGTGYAYAAKLRYTDYGLTLDEASSVRTLYVYDHPLYYWVSASYVYSSTAIYLCVDSTYADEKTRTDTNRLIYSEIERVSQTVTDETDGYAIALAYYEILLAAADYAYEEDGVTPEDAPWAHNVLGVFEKGLAVCEGFAKAYSLVLNFHGVENLPVSGDSNGVPHLWNLINPDGTGWYWCDITWDDPTTSALGTDYKYFCVNDTQDVLYYYIRDGLEAGMDYTIDTSAVFLDNHTVRWDASIRVDMSEAVPARAAAPYDYEGLTLREVFKDGDAAYALVGYRQVQIIDFGSAYRVTVPETVSLDGITYTVVSVGLLGTGGACLQGSMLSLLTRSVHLPKTVRYVWDRALQGIFVQISVDENSPYYTVSNGKLTPKT